MHIVSHYNDALVLPVILIRNAPQSQCEPLLLPGRQSVALQTGCHCLGKLLAQQLDRQRALWLDLVTQFSVNLQRAS